MSLESLQHGVATKVVHGENKYNIALWSLMAARVTNNVL